MSDSEPLPEPAASATPAEKAKQFPPSPGVYLMKDAQGRVIYIGKAKNLRNRASHYFTKIAAEDMRTADLVKVIADIDFVEAETEVDALVWKPVWSRTSSPASTSISRTTKLFPICKSACARNSLARIHSKPPGGRSKTLRTIYQCRSLRAAIQVLQRIFQFRTCSLDIQASDMRWRWFRPCLLHSIRQCTAPCNLRVTREEYMRQIRSLRMVLEGRRAGSSGR